MGGLQFCSSPSVVLGEKWEDFSDQIQEGLI
jgi:hypothetical protein